MPQLRQDLITGVGGRPNEARGGPIRFTQAVKKNGGGRGPHICVPLLPRDEAMTTPEVLATGAPGGEP